MALENVRIVAGDMSAGLQINAESGENHRLTGLYIAVDPARISQYIDIKIGAHGITRIPVRLGNSNFVDTKTGYQSYNIVSLIRNFFGDDVYLEADESEDIVITGGALGAESVNSADTIVAEYEVFTEKIDKTKTGRSGANNYMLFSIAEKTLAFDAASDTYSFDTAQVLPGLPDIIDGYIVPTAVNLVGKSVTGAVVNPSDAVVNSAKLHLRDDTFEFFDPIDRVGVEFQTEPTLDFDVNTRRYYPLSDYVIKPGHQIGLNATVNITAGTAGNLYLYTVLSLLMTRVR